MPKMKFVIVLGVAQSIPLMVKDLFKDSQIIRITSHKSAVNELRSQLVSEIFNNYWPILPYAINIKFQLAPFYSIMAKQLQEIEHIDPKEFEADCKDYAPDPNEDYMVF